MPTAAAPQKAGLKAWLPMIATLLLAPVCTWAVGQFVLIPQLQKKIAATPATEEAAAESGAHGGGHGGGHGGKDGKDGSPNYQFENVVVNLAGTMGTRYLKTSFLVTGADANIKAVFEGEQAEAHGRHAQRALVAVRSPISRSPAPRTCIREKLVTAYNQALGRKVADQVYFSDFVVQ